MSIAADLNVSIASDNRALFPRIFRDSIFMVIAAVHSNVVITAAVNAFNLAAGHRDRGAAAHSPKIEQLIYLFFCRGILITGVPARGSTAENLEHFAAGHFNGGIADSVAADAAAVNTIWKVADLSVRFILYPAATTYLFEVIFGRKIQVVPHTASRTMIPFLLAVRSRRELRIPAEQHICIAGQRSGGVAAGYELVDAGVDLDVGVRLQIIIAAAVDYHALPAVLAAAEALVQHQLVALGVDGLGADIDVREGDVADQVQLVAGGGQQRAAVAGYGDVRAVDAHGSRAYVHVTRQDNSRGGFIRACNFRNRAFPSLRTADLILRLALR